MACCPDDRALVAEGHGRHLRQVSAGGAVTTFAGGGAVGSQDGQGTDGRAVHHIARDSAGNIRVSIRVINLAANRVHTVTGGTEGFADGAGLVAQLKGSRGVACDNAGHQHVQKVCIRLGK